MTLEPGRPGGSETNVRGVLAEFSRGLPGLSTTVLATDRVLRAYGDLGGEHVRFASVPGYPGAQSAARRFASLLASRPLGRVARRALPREVAVSHYPLTVMAPALPRPRVTTVFDLNHHDLPHLWSRAQRLYRGIAYDRAARTATVVITASSYSRARLVDVLGVDPDRIRVARLGIDHSQFSPEPDETDVVLDDQRLAERFVLYPAALLPHKNHHRLLRALALTQDRRLELVLTGQDHGAWPPLAALAAQLGIARRVRHLGFLERRLLPALYRRAAGVVFPSLYEGFGAPPLEAMACGSPVATSFAASLRELCEGATVEIDPLDVESIASGIERVACDEGLRARLKVAGLQRATHYTWRRTAEEHLAAYRLATEMA